MRTQWVRLRGKLKALTTGTIEYLLQNVESFDKSSRLPMGIGTVRDFELQCYNYNYELKNLQYEIMIICFHSCPLSLQHKHVLAEEIGTFKKNNSEMLRQAKVLKKYCMWTRKPIQLIVFGDKFCTKIISKVPKG